MEPIARTLREGELLEQLAWLQALARSLVRDAASADDLVQDTWLAASAHAPTMDASGLRNWLATVARNFARRGARAQERRARRESAVARPEAHVEDVVARGELQQRLAAAVISLDEPERSAVLLRYLDGLNAVEIAERQGVTHVAARKRISRGLAKLREKLDAQHGGDRNAWIVALHSWVGHGEPVAASSTVFVSGVLVMFGKVVAAAALVVAIWLSWSALDSDASKARGADAAQAQAQFDAPNESAASTDGRRSETGLDLAKRSRSLRLVDEAGAPRSGFTAVLLDGSRWLATKLSDTDGRVELSNELRPTAMIVAREGFTPMRLELDSEGGAESLLVPSGEKVAGRLLYASAERVTRLELTDDRDTPELAKLDDEALRELEKLGISERKHVLTLDNSGVFAFEGLDESWTGAIELPDSWRFVRGPGDFTEDDRSLLLLTPTERLELALLSPLIIRGRVVDERTRAGRSGARVSLSRIGGAWPEAQSDSIGQFELRLPRPRSARDEQEDTATLTVELDLLRRSFDLRIPWRELERTPFIGDFELPHVRSLELHVTDEGGVPISDAEAEVTLKGRIEGRQSDSTGRISFSALPEVWVSMSVQADGYAKIDVPLTSNARVDVVLVRTNRINLRLLAGSGGPLRDNSIAVNYWYAGEPEPWELESSTDQHDRGFCSRYAGGLWVLSDLRRGAPLVVSVWKFDFARGQVLELLRHNMTTPDQARTVELELVVPAIVGRYFIGRVIDEFGRGVPRANVRIKHSNGSLSLDTSEDGRFSSKQWEASIHEIEEIEVTRPGFVPVVFDGAKLLAGEEQVLKLERGHSLEALVLDVRGRSINSDSPLAAFGERATVLGTPLGDGRFRFDAVPNVAGELRLELGGVTHTTAIGANDTFVRFTLPATGELHVTVAPGSYDENSMVCVVLSPASSASAATSTFFRKSDGELMPLTLTLPEGRYRIQLESHVLGGVASNVETLGPAREIEIVAGKLLALTLP